VTTGSPEEPRAAVAPLLRYGGWVVAGVGVLLLILGWYGVSGQSLEAKQLPYVASASLPGAALVVSGAVLIAAERVRAGRDADRMVADLYRMLVEPEPAVRERAEVAAPGGEPPEDGRWTVPGTLTFHRAGCVLVAGKPEAERVTDERLASLTPCPVCRPD
jgi:hypothetical protein